MTQTPKVSVIIPVYNVESFLNKCINSVINQTYSNLEIILVDDASPDNCGKMCDDYAITDSRIKVIHQKNQGLSGARNSGMKIATGDYVAFLDSDDWIHPKMYEIMTSIAITNNLEIVECDVIERINEDSDDSNFNISIDDAIIEDGVQAIKRIIKNSQLSVCKRIYKKELIENQKFEIGKTSEDIYFTIDIVKKIQGMGYLKFPFYNYRSNPTSITKSSYSLKRLNDSINASLYLREKMEDYKLTDNELIKIIKNHMLWKFLLHYKRINYNSHLDIDYFHRKKIKSYIKEEYYKNPSHDFYMKLANFLSVKQFEVLIKLNLLKHKVLKTNALN